MNKLFTVRRDFKWGLKRWTYHYTFHRYIPFYSFLLWLRLCQEKPIAPSYCTMFSRNYNKLSLAYLFEVEVCRIISICNVSFSSTAILTFVRNGHSIVDTHVPWWSYNSDIENRYNDYDKQWHPLQASISAFQLLIFSSNSHWLLLITHFVFGFSNFLSLWNINSWYCYISAFYDIIYMINYLQRWGYAPH